MTAKKQAKTPAKKVKRETPGKVAILLTDEQYLELAVAAEESSLPLSLWARMTLLKVAKAEADKAA